LEQLTRIKDRVLGIRKWYVPDFEPRIYVLGNYVIYKRLAKLPNWNWGRWMPLDAKYYTVSLEDFEKIIEWDKTNRHKYFMDRFDCDKYAMYLKGNIAWFFGINAVAVVLDYSSGHAYNLLFPYDVDRPLILEPQTDQIIEVEGRDKRYYALEDYYVVV